MLCMCGKAASAQWFPYCSKTCYDYWHKGITRKKKK